MRMRSVRRPTTPSLTGAAAAVLVLAGALLGVPGVAQAEGVPPVGDGPVGSALIRVDGGGAAHVRQTADATYRVVLPRRAQIRWLGETVDRTLAIGRFTPGRLVERWRALGHRRTAPVVATLTWRAADGSASAVLATVSDLRRRSDGRLAFSVTTDAVLPDELRKYSVNIRRAAPQARVYPVEGTPFNITSTVYMVAQADRADAASGRIFSGDTTCWSYTHSLTSNQMLTFKVTCGSVSFAERSHVTITEQTNATPAAETANLKLVVNNKGMSFNQVLVQWDALSLG